MAILTKRRVQALRPGEIAWCDSPKGFGARALPSGKTVFVLKYRAGIGRRARQRWITLGTFGDLTVEQARAAAVATLKSVAMAKLGLQAIDPAERRDKLKKAETVGELCRLYIDAMESGDVISRASRKPKRPSTIAIDKGRIERHILPLLGTMRVADVTRQDVERFASDVRRGKTAATIVTGPRGRAVVRGGAGTARRTLGLLGSIFAHAERLGLRSDNPCRGIRRDADGKRSVFLTPEQYRALGRVLDAAPANGARRLAADITRLIALTGLRRGEAVGIKWSEVDFQGRALRLQDSKTGASVRPLGSAALDCLRALHADRGASEYVFPALRGTGPFGGFPKLWRDLAEDAGMPELTPHGLRHAFASVADQLGMSLPTIAALLGHSLGKNVTARYVARVDSVLLAAADKVSRWIDDAMRRDEAGATDNILSLSMAVER